MKKQKTTDDDLPEPSLYDKDDQPLYALDDLLAHWRIPEDKVESLLQKFMETHKKQLNMNAISKSKQLH